MAVVVAHIAGVVCLLLLRLVHVRLVHLLEWAAAAVHEAHVDMLHGSIM